MTTERTIELLRAAAGAGDARAARELGRLLCLTTQEEPDPPWPVPRWPGERWLRAALELRPDDGQSALLLAGVLVQQLDACLVMNTACPYADEDPDIRHAESAIEAAVVRRRDEALELYRRVLRADPDDPSALAGLHGLRLSFEQLPRYGGPFGNTRRDDLFPAEPRGAADPPEYAYYRLEASLYCGSAGSVGRLLAVDPGELRWAGDRMLIPPLSDEGTELTLTVHQVGCPSTVLALDRYLLRDTAAREHDRRPPPDTTARLDWDAFTIPPLTGTPLPAGHAVEIDQGFGKGVSSYGFDLHHDI